MKANKAENSFDPEWKEKYKELIVTADHAVSHIQPGSRVFVGTGCAQPNRLVHALTARSKQLTDTEIVHLLTLGDAPYADSELIQHFLESFSSEAKLNLHAKISAGVNDHHKVEALFKALARTLDQATRIDKRIKGRVPSTKEIIES